MTTKIKPKVETFLLGGLNFKSCSNQWPSTGNNCVTFIRSLYPTEPIIFQVCFAIRVLCNIVLLPSREVSSCYAFDQNAFDLKCVYPKERVDRWGPCINGYSFLTTSRLTSCPAHAHAPLALIDIIVSLWIFLLVLVAALTRGGLSQHHQWN